MTTNNENKLWDTLREDIDAHIERRFQRMRPARWQAASSVLAAVVSLLTILTLVAYSGRLVERLQALADRVVLLESAGSASLQKHIAQDTAETVAIRERIAALERIADAIPRIESGVSALTVKVDMLAKQFNGHQP